MAGRINDAVRRLRGLNTLRGQAFLVAAYVQADRIADAVEALRENANRFGQPQFLLRAATLLGNLGRLEEAREAATNALSLAPRGSTLAKEARAVLIEASSRLRDWTGVAQHSSAAIADGFDTPDVRWALLWAHFSRRDFVTGLKTYQAAPVRPRNEDDTILLTQLLRTSGNSQDAVRQLLGLADEYRGSERVNAAVFMGVSEVSRDAELPDELRTRQQQLMEAFFGAWPDSKILYRIDASDIQNVVDYLRESLQTVRCLG